MSFLSWEQKNKLGTTREETWEPRAPSRRPGQALSQAEVPWGQESPGEDDVCLFSTCPALRPRAKPRQDTHSVGTLKTSLSAGKQSSNQSFNLGPLGQ